MTDSSTETPPPGVTPEDANPEPVQPATPKAERKGWAVYNDTLGQYVGAVTRDKPSRSDAKALVPTGHKFTVREV